MKEIMLTQGKVAFVDDNDYDMLIQYKWYTHFVGNNWYACWRVRIKYKGWHMHGGYFNDEEAAAREYDRRARLLFGEFAYLNFPKKET